MTRRTSAWLTALALIPGVALAACAGRTAARVPLEKRTDTLRFREVTSGAVFEGAITFGDSVTAQVAGVPCRDDVRAYTRSSEYVVFDCGESRISLSRLNPEQRSSYAIRVPTRTARRFCDEYGPRGCVRYSTDYAVNLVWRSFPLRFIEQ